MSALLTMLADAWLQPTLVALVPLLPLLAAAAIVPRLLAAGDPVALAEVAAQDAEEIATAAIARGAALGSALLLLALGLAALVAGTPGTLALMDWFAVPGFVVPLSFIVDPLSLSIAGVVAVIGWITLAFSTNYLHREPGFHRFFFGMSLFLSGMLLIVLAGNAVLAFVGWECCGVASWLLIGFADERPVATGNALFAFLANRVGDAGFLLAIGLAYWWLDSVAWSVIAGGAIPEAVKARMLAVGLLTAALAKSAQLPFTPWIARALEGPTPSSAVFYGALMIHAGVFLLIRIGPLLLQVPDMMVGIALLGLATSLYAWLCGRVQTDVKSALIHATVAQVGLMLIACGLGWFTLAAWHLALHAIWRAYQFLMAPSYLLLAPSPLPLPRWLRRQTFLYTAALQGFWLDRLIRGLLVRPTLALGRDVCGLDRRVFDRLLGGAHGPATRAGDGDAAARGSGPAGRLLVWAAALLQRFEDRLVLQDGGGGAAQMLQRVGDMLRTVEAFLEQPRYLMLMVMATFVVIL